MKKGRAVPYSPQSMQVYLQKSFSSLLWHTSITRKMSKKRNPQNFDSEDTKPFSRIWTRSSTSLCWILVLKTKVVKDPFFSLKRQLKEAQQRKESVSSNRKMGTSSSHFSPRNGPFMLWSELVIWMKKSKPRQSQKWNQNIGACYTTTSGTHLVVSVGWRYMVRTALPSWLRGSRQFP